MPRARREQISLAETPYYHCISRCVRRAFLCGFDRHSGRDYEHRRAWIRDKLAELVEVFAIDLCAYAIMSNHYHVVLRANLDRARAWSDDEVLERWCQLCKGPDLVRMYRQESWTPRNFGASPVCVGSLAFAECEIQTCTNSFWGCARRGMSRMSALTASKAG
jgi:hypothetical protein